MTGRRVLRYEVPVDDQWHRVEFVGDVAHVGCRTPEVVEFWATPGVRVHRVHDGMGQLISERYGEVYDKPRTREFRVFPTGEPVDSGLHVGTTFAADGAIVWHLFERGVGVFDATG